MRRLLVVITSMTLVMSLAGTATAAKPKTETPDVKSDYMSSPQADKQIALRQKGLEKLLEGKVTPRGDNKVVRVAKGQYVELARRARTRS